MPLQEPATLSNNNSENGTAPQNYDVNDISEPIEESKEVQANQENMMSSEAICNDLEMLLETGYAQLNQSRVDFEATNEENLFPKGITIYDGDSDDNSNYESDEVEGGYEVICSREV